MEWEDDASRMLQEYLEAVCRASNERGGNGGAVANGVQQRIIDRLRASGERVVTPALLQRVLDQAGPPGGVAALVTPPPLPPAGSVPPAPMDVPPVVLVKKQRSTAVSCMLIGLIGFGFLLMLTVVAAPILLPAFARAREAALRSSCQNNMQQLGLTMMIYANEHDERFPPFSTDIDHLMFGSGIIDPGFEHILQCPAEDDMTPTDPDYIYLGYTVRTQEELDAVVDAYIAKGRDPQALLEMEGIPSPQGPVLPLNPNNPNAATIPVMVEWDGIHVPDGGNVLYLDGHVEYVPWEHKFPMTGAFFDSVSRVWH